MRERERERGKEREEIQREKDREKNERGTNREIKRKQMRRNESEKAYLKGKNLWKINIKEMQKNMRVEIQQERF